MSWPSALVGMVLYSTSLVTMEPNFLQLLNHAYARKSDLRIKRRETAEYWSKKCSDLRAIQDNPYASNVDLIYVANRLEIYRAEEDRELGEIGARIVETDNEIGNFRKYLYEHEKVMIAQRALQDDRESLGEFDITGMGPINIMAGETFYDYLQRRELGRPPSVEILSPRDRVKYLEMKIQRIRAGATIDSEERKRLDAEIQEMASAGTLDEAAMSGLRSRMLECERSTELENRMRQDRVKKIRADIDALKLAYRI